MISTFLLKTNKMRFIVVIVYVTFDILSLLLSFYFTYLSRFKSEYFLTFPPALYQPELFSDAYFIDHLQLISLMGLVLVFLNFQNGLYTTSRGERFFEELGLLIKNVFLAFTVGIIVSFILKWQMVSRLVFVFSAIVLLIMLAFWRYFKRKFVEYLVSKGYARERALIVGAGKIGSCLESMINDHPEMGIDIAGFLDDNHKNGKNLTVKGKLLGEIDSFDMHAKELSVNRVFITIPSIRRKVQKLIDEANSLGISIYIVPEFYDLMFSQVSFKNIGSLSLLHLHKTTLKLWQKKLKRFSDLLVSSAIVFVASPLLLLIALAIRIDTPGPVIYKQKRVAGPDKEFFLYKFRSMYSDADQSKHRELAKAWVTSKGGYNEEEGVYKLVDDDRITPVGKLIRKLNLDELPQFFNVLRGDMSIVGPRPPLPYEYEEYKDYHKNRLLALPGITGFWQVNGLHKLSFEEMVLLDIRYINEWSIWLDLEIMLRTVPMLLFGRGR